MANQHTAKKSTSAKPVLNAKPKGDSVKNAETFKETFLSSYSEPLRFSNPPDNDSEFIAELSDLISKWNGRPGTEAQAFAKAYKAVLAQYLNPDEA